MKIKEIVSQSRRDFRAIFECENCDTTIDMDGYDDDNFHRNVIPEFKCPKCDMKAPDSYRPLTTKYHADEVV